MKDLNWDLGLTFDETHGFLFEKMLVSLVNNGSKGV
jgi:hypothetical protein